MKCDIVNWRGFEIEIKNLFSESVTYTASFQSFSIDLARCDFFSRCIGFQIENKKLAFLKHDIQCTRHVFNESLFIWQRVFLSLRRGFKIEIKNLFS